MKRILVLGWWVVCGAWVGAAESTLPSLVDESLRKEVARAQERAFAWLLKQQRENGSWNDHPAITGLALTALYRSHRELTIEQREAAERAEKFILSCVKPTGAIYGGGENDKYPNYSTAICIMALLASGKEEYRPVIQRAREFLLGSQFDEGEGYTPDNPSYGGIGYGRRQRPDMSNMAWALEALKLTESLETAAGDSPHEGARLHWQKAIQFLQRCQKLPEFNDQPWAKETRDEDRGGFIYMPGDPAQGIPPFSFADEAVTTEPKPLRAHASMSYAGLKSYIYADLKKDDPRVVAVVDWLRRYYTLDENPGVGQQGLYYYYQMMAKALTAYGEDTFTTADGKKRDWRYEMMQRFVQLQRADGYWQNDNNRWWENDPVLVTCYSLLALEVLQRRHYP
ncbi:MAG: terpene cyclase/mutase family protein [Verrucomicrobiae bacterium]|nr:terpene cyclase/mutase family protein [Verrucomicrobiae bacterium]